MTVTMFLMLLSAFSVISGLVTESIKKLVNDKVNLSWNITALVVALIIGSCGCFIYYQLSAIAFSLNNIIYAMLMGLASGLVSMIGYDKVKQAVLQIASKTE